MRFVKREISVATKDGPIAVNAMVFGVFAIHPSIPVWAAPAWSVTHVPTGYAIGTNYVAKSIALQLVMAIKDFPEWDAIQKPSDTTEVLAEKVKKAKAGLKGLPLKKVFSK